MGPRVKLGIYNRCLTIIIAFVWCTLDYSDRGAESNPPSPNRVKLMIQCLSKQLFLNIGPHSVHFHFRKLYVFIYETVKCKDKSVRDNF